MKQRILTIYVSHNHQNIVQFLLLDGHYFQEIVSKFRKNARPKIIQNIF